MRKLKPLDSKEYIFIRLDENLKKRLKEQAKVDGSNMTIWVRQLIMKALTQSKEQ